MNSTGFRLLKQNVFRLSDGRRFRFDVCVCVCVFMCLENSLSCDDNVFGLKLFGLLHFLAPTPASNTGMAQRAVAVLKADPVQGVIWFTQEVSCPLISYLARVCPSFREQ